MHMLNLTAEAMEKIANLRNPGTVAATSEDSGKTPVAGSDDEGGNDSGKGKGSDEGGSEGDDENIPFHKHPRFQKVLQDKKDALKRESEKDARIAALEAKMAEANDKGSGIDPNMSFEDAMKKMKEDLRSETIAAMKADQAKESSENSFYENLVNDGFDYLRDIGHKISAKDEDAIAEIAMKYKIAIKEPEDLLNAYEIFDLSRKTAGNGKSKEDTTITNDRAKGKSDPLDYSKVSWSNIGANLSKRILGNQS